MILSTKLRIMTKCYMENVHTYHKFDRIHKVLKEIDNLWVIDSISGVSFYQRYI